MVRFEADVTLMNWRDIAESARDHGRGVAMRVPLVLMIDVKSEG